MQTDRTFFLPFSGVSHSEFVERHWNCAEAWSSTPHARRCSTSNVWIFESPAVDGVVFFRTTGPPASFCPQTWPEHARCWFALKTEFVAAMTQVRLGTDSNGQDSQYAEEHLSWSSSMNIPTVCPCLPNHLGTLSVKSKCFRIWLDFFRCRSCWLKLNSAFQLDRDFGGQFF